VRAAPPRGQFFWTRALHLAPATAVSPFFYLLLVWALIIGYVVWGDVPTPGLLAGSAIVVAAGLLRLWHETVRRRSERAITERRESEDQRAVSART
jgi:drug/metabolite transporter (DMT)-like permease